MKRILRILIAAFCPLLAACGSTDIKDSLGLTHKAPDEFRVYARPPLSVPPDFNIKAPVKGSEYSSGTPADEQAHGKILTDSQTVGPATTSPVSPFGNSALPATGHFLNAPADTAVPVVTTNALPDAADAQFLANAGASHADPHIREELDQEKNGTFTDKKSPYLFGGKKQSDAEVDPAKEAARLKQDKAQDKPPTVGDTPVIEQKDKGLLGDIF